jgi:hypothetical protein
MRGQRWLGWLFHHIRGASGKHHPGRGKTCQFEKTPAGQIRFHSSLALSGPLSKRSSRLNSPFTPSARRPNRFRYSSLEHLLTPTYGYSRLRRRTQTASKRRRDSTPIMHAASTLVQTPARPWASTTRPDVDASRLQSVPNTHRAKDGAGGRSSCMACSISLWAPRTP